MWIASHGLHVACTGNLYYQSCLTRLLSWMAHQLAELNCCSNHDHHQNQRKETTTPTMFVCCVARRVTRRTPTGSDIEETQGVRGSPVGVHNTPMMNILLLYSTIARAVCQRMVHACVISPTRRFSHFIISFETKLLELLLI